VLTVFQLLKIFMPKKLPEESSPLFVKLTGNELTSFFFLHLSINSCC
jgi:hypothetical protein